MRAIAVYPFIEALKSTSPGGHQSRQGIGEIGQQISHHHRKSTSPMEESSLTYRLDPGKGRAASEPGSPIVFRRHLSQNNTVPLQVFPCLLNIAV